MISKIPKSSTSIVKYTRFRSIHFRHKSKSTRNLPRGKTSDQRRGDRVQSGKNKPLKHGIRGSF